MTCNTKSKKKALIQRVNVDYPAGSSRAHLKIEKMEKRSNHILQFSCVLINRTMTGKNS